MQPLTLTSLQSPFSAVKRLDLSLVKAALGPTAQHKRHDMDFIISTYCKENPIYVFLFW